MHYYNIAIELVVSFIALFAITKILGKTLITQITPFDFISAIVLSELVGNALYDSEVGVSSILFALTLWGLLIYITEWITQKFITTRGFLEGKPSILINKGKISFKELKKNHLDLNQLQHLLRSRDVFTMREVEYAILETDGTLNVLKKYIYDTPRRQDKNDVTDKEIYLPLTLISDGEIVWKNLTLLGHSKSWLTLEINKQGYSSVEEVLFGEWLEGEGLYLQGY
ncbi:YetF domain-containing protein [Alkalibaculum sporogenes]|uniref:YetF domain-containing protein n=1 Tax=Alkalibaculum sporogenes TaxID=2655001 RepID=UPI001A9B3722